MYNVGSNDGLKEMFFNPDGHMCFGPKKISNSIFCHLGSGIKFFENLKVGPGEIKIDALGNPVGSDICELFQKLSR